MRHNRIMSPLKFANATAGMQSDGSAATINQIALWVTSCGAQVSRAGDHLDVHTTFGTREVTEGDWVLLDSAGFHVVAPENLRLSWAA